MTDDLDAAGGTAGPYRITVLGHDRAVGTLIADARAGAAHAVLVSGPPAVGKRTVARLLAQALMCTSRLVEDRPCGACRACRLVRDGTAPDLRVTPVPLRIDDVRELRRDLALSPNESARHVAVLPEIELASPGAANSLLKTLEEPPSHAVLVLTTAARGEVLATVLSRCRHVALRPIPVDDVAMALTASWGVDPERARLLARLSGGRLGWAVRAAEDAAALETREWWLEALEKALASDRAGRLALAAELVRDRESLADGLAVWSGWWRDLLLVRYGVEEPVVNHDRLAGMRAAATGVAPGDIVRALRAIEDTLRRLASRVNAQLAVEVLLLEMPAR